MSPDRLTFEAAIAEQPIVLERIAAHLLAQLDAGRLDRLAGTTRPLFVGIGASYAALALPVALLEDAGLPARRMLASDVAGNPSIGANDALIGVSQGGKSVETIEAFERAGTPIRIAVLNRAGSPLADSATAVFDLGQEPDSWASTIGYTGTLMALSMIAASIVGADPAAPWDGIRRQLERFRPQAVAFAARLADRLAAVASADLVATRASASSAEAGALLFREIARLPSTASRTRNYLHGEMEAAGRTLHVVFGDDREIALAESLADAGHLTVLLTTRPIADRPQLLVLRMPEVAAPLATVLETVALQELGAVLAHARGIDIEEFVFANHDIKLGGITEIQFAADNN